MTNAALSVFGSGLLISSAKFSPSIVSGILIFVNPNKDGNISGVVNGALTVRPLFFPIEG